MIMLPEFDPGRGEAGVRFVAWLNNAPVLPRDSRVLWRFEALRTQDPVGVETLGHHVGDRTDRLATDRPPAPLGSRVLRAFGTATSCRRRGIEFVLDHALYMKAIHRGKAKNDKIDALKIATLLRGGMFPQAYVYPPEMRATRDLLRRRLHLVRRRANLLAHIQNTHHQYNLDPPAAKIAYKAHREGVAEAFTDTNVRESVEIDFALIGQYDAILRTLELHPERRAKQHDPQAYHRLRSVPGIGKILALTILYEIHEIERFPRVQDFLSYSRLVKCDHSSAGKKLGTGRLSDPRQGARLRVGSLPGRGEVKERGWMIQPSNWSRLLDREARAEPVSRVPRSLLDRARQPAALIGDPPPLRTFADRRGAFLREALPLARARRSLDIVSQVEFEWTGEGTDEFLGHGGETTPSKSPDRCWVQAREGLEPEDGNEVGARGGWTRSRRTLPRTAGVKGRHCLLTTGGLIGVRPRAY